jgi:glucoamylase
LTGERGHYALAAGGDPSVFLRAMEGFATSTGLLPEQVWDSTDRPTLHLELGRPTESAVPLVWAHAEYLKLLRSAKDKRAYDQPPEVAERYCVRTPREPREVWKFNRQPKQVRVGESLRVITDRPFRLHSSRDGWTTTQEVPSMETRIGLHYVDLPPLSSPKDSWRFTFHWRAPDRWEGHDFRVDAAEPAER